jgi:hypothetical protein
VSALLFVGMANWNWMQAVNKVFEQTVRNQTDRGRRVIDAALTLWWSIQI